MKFISIALHISTGTFKPIVVENIEDHSMDPELFEIGKNQAIELNNAKLNNRIISIGTTSTRVIEYCYNKNNYLFKEEEGLTNLFIYPGYHFNAISGMITNFHMPRSTPYLLVTALGGFDLVKKAYKIAIEKKFRFYSYGDSMLIL